MSPCCKHALHPPACHHPCLPLSPFPAERDDVNKGIRPYVICGLFLFPFIPVPPSIADHQSPISIHPASADLAVLCRMLPLDLSRTALVPKLNRIWLKRWEACCEWLRSRGGTVCLSSHPQHTPATHDHSSPDVNPGIIRKIVCNKTLVRNNRLLTREREEKNASSTTSIGSLSLSDTCNDPKIQWSANQTLTL